MIMWISLLSFINSDNLLPRLARHAFLILSMISIFSWVVFMREGETRGIGNIIASVTANSVFFFGYAYLTAYLLVPKLLLRRRILYFILAFLSSGILISILKFTVSDYIFYSAISADLNSRSFPLNLSEIVVNTKDMTFIVAIFLIAKYARDNYKINRRLGEVRDHQIRSEIKLLRNQLNPHVVFNNLNNIYSLALNNSPTLAQNITNLRSVLSYYFRDGKEDTVPIHTELEVIRNYISLEKLRYGDRLKVDFKTEGEMLGNIVPFVLFSFIENCFEHGCSIDSGIAWIKVHVISNKNSLVFHASNSRPLNLLVENSNKGSDLRSRLELLYPGRHILRIDDRKDMYCVDLKLKLYN